MYKEIKRIHIDLLCSENNIFDPITFHKGINLILGEKCDNTTIQGRKTTGVGKSLCIEFLDFCFLNDYNYSRLKKIPENILPLEENIILKLHIGNINLTIKRNRKNETKPIIIKMGKIINFNNLEDARNYLNELLYQDYNSPSIPSFRNLLSILMRDERSEFLDILKCHDLSKNIPVDLTPHLFLLGIDIDLYSKILRIIKQIDDLNILIRNNKKELTTGNKKISDVHAELNALNDDLNKIEVAIDSFKSNEAFDSLQKDIIELETLLEKLRKKQSIVRYEYNKIKNMPKPEEIDDDEIELIYNQFKEDLGVVIVKSLREMVGFKNKVEDFQKVLINQRAKELQNQLKELSDNIKELDNEYASKVSILDQKGILKNLKTTLKIFEEKKRSSEHIRHLFNQYEKNTKKKMELKIEKSQEILTLDNLLDQNKIKIDDIEITILNIHEKIMGNKEASLSIKTNDSSQSKTPVLINLRIYDDGSHSVNRTKVFIYDVALMFNKYTSNYHPSFLVHDNIFDVDQDTLVQCLNYLYEVEKQNDDFQYILTLNRDKIEAEERMKLIKLDIAEHTVASFTKQNKFLKCNYQEI